VELRFESEEEQGIERGERGKPVDPQSSEKTETMSRLFSRRDVALRYDGGAQSPRALAVNTSGQSEQRLSCITLRPASIRKKQTGMARAENLPKFLRNS
jgi:hypothetical protein